MLYVGDLSAVPDLIASAPLNLDGHPVIEFMAPRLTRMNARGDKDWLTGAALAEYTETLTARLAGRPEPALPPTEEMRQARRAGAALFRYAIAATTGKTDQAQGLMSEISRLVPDVIAAVRGEAPAVRIADVQRNLGQLQAEHERLRQRLQSMEERLRSTPTNEERR
jgi:hypothetical protein